MSETVLAFDYGERYIGVAIGDTETGIALPAGHYNAARDVERYARAADLVREWRPARLVVGLPLGLEGEERVVTARSRRFARVLSARTGLPVELVDERHSSTSAEESLRELLKKSGHGARRHKRESHALAAQIVLQAYLDERMRERMRELNMREPKSA